MTPSYALGLFFIFLVSIIWSAASIVVQHLYRDMDFHSPFLLTYVSTGLFVLFLPTRLLWERRKKISRWACRALTGRWANGGSAYRAVGMESDGDCDYYEEEEQIIPWKNSQELSPVEDNVPEGDDIITGQDSISLSGSLEMTSADDTTGGETAAYQAVEASIQCGGNAPNDVNDGEEQGNEAESSHDFPGESTNCNNDNESCNLTVLGTSDEPGGLLSNESQIKSSLHTAETSESTLTAQTDTSNRPSASTPHLLSHVDHIRMALRIGPVWFLSNYFYNTSLAYTSISSSTVLASTGSLFTFLFAVTCGDEKVNASKLAGVALCFAGSVLTGLSDAEAAAWEEQGSSLVNATYLAKPTASLEDVATDGIAPLSSDPSQSESHSGLQLLGDLAGLISAIGYGTYTVLIRTLCPKDESRMSMQLLLGYIGGLNGLVLLPVAIKMLLFDSCAFSGDSNADFPDYSDPGMVGATRASPDSVSACGQITLVVVAYLLGKAFFDNVLSDYLWARAVVLTSATVATVGLGLTIPLAFLSDWFMGHANVVSLQSVAGAVAVLFGFIFVNCGEA